MGGVIHVNGTAYSQGGLKILHEAIEAEKQYADGYVSIECAHDLIRTEIDQRVIFIHNSHQCFPEQIEVTVEEETPPPPANVVKYVTTSQGVPLNVRNQPTTAGALVAKVYRGDKLELRPGWTATANGFTWWQVLKVNGVAVPSGATWYTVDKYLSDTDPN